MIKKLFTAGWVSILFSTSAWVHAEDLTMVPGEMRGCKSVEGASMNDLNASMAKMTDWLKADEHGYELWLATPHFKPDQGYDFDMLWIVRDRGYAGDQAAVNTVLERGGVAAVAGTSIDLSGLDVVSSASPIIKFPGRNADRETWTFNNWMKSIHGGAQLTFYAKKDTVGAQFVSSF